MSSYAKIYLHFVFSTKHRRPDINPEWESRLYSVMGGTLRTIKCTLLAAGGIEDHVHLLVSMARDVSASTAMRNVKTDSSKWVHDTFAEASDFHWQDGFAVFSVSHSQLDVVRAYIARQKEHHSKQSFQDELLELLRLHEIEFDERYIWD